VLNLDKLPRKEDKAPNLSANNRVAAVLALAAARPLPATLATVALRRCPNNNSSSNSNSAAGVAKAMEDKGEEAGFPPLKKCRIQAGRSLTLLEMLSAR
jgi:hypothetical protein